MQGSILSVAGDKVLTSAAEYLTFLLGSEEYGVPIDRVKELRAWQPVSRIPFAKSWECGLINVRGAIVPVFDLRVRIGLSKISYHSHTVIVLFRINKGGRECEQGAVVDELTDVFKVSANQSHILTDSESGQTRDLASHVIESGGRKIRILDLARIFSLQAD